MQVQIKDNNLVITMPLQTPSVSKSGKTLIVATSAGIKATTAEIDGKPIKVGVNAFIAK